MLKRIILNNIWLIVFFIAIIFLFSHTFNLFDLKVDSTSIILLILILLSPFITSIKKLKYGEFEAEINSDEIQKIKSELEDVRDNKDNNTEETFPIYREVESILELSKNDKIIALAKLRIELEKLLIRFHSSMVLESRKLPLTKVVVELVNLEVMSKKIGKSLNEVITICNRAIHGDYISEENADLIIDLGTDLIDEVYWLFKEQTSSGTILSKNIINTEEVENLRDESFYELTTIIPLVENPEKIVRKVTQEQLEEILENYQEYAEFIVSLKKLK